MDHAIDPADPAAGPFSRRQGERLFLTRAVGRRHFGRQMLRRGLRRILAGLFPDNVKRLGRKAVLGHELRAWKKQFFSF